MSMYRKFLFGTKGSVELRIQQKTLWVENRGRELVALGLKHINIAVGYVLLTYRLMP